MDTDDHARLEFAHTLLHELEVCRPLPVQLPPSLRRTVFAYLEIHRIPKCRVLRRRTQVARGVHCRMAQAENEMASKGATQEDFVGMNFGGKTFLSPVTCVSEPDNLLNHHRRRFRLVRTTFRNLSLEGRRQIRAGGIAWIW
ncbi:hypothetical protein [Rhodococcus marinonascens]|uniref:hypothetical protein n=1 Tax=Rhodococcus marinonascens TaxID=38311 RepID=UPI001114D7F7|nr:hypothetical protein [Rhodococcus marinonascens]